jgi:hypothetical protein
MAKDDNVVKLFETVEDKIKGMIDDKSAVIVLSYDDDGLSIGSNSEIDTIIMMLEAAKFKLLENITYQ